MERLTYLETMMYPEAKYKKESEIDNNIIIILFDDNQKIHPCSLIINNGLVIKKVLYNHGIKDLTFDYKYGENRLLKEQYSYNDETEHLYTSYYENGNVKCSSHYKDGKLDGLSLGWYENGDKWYEIYYKNGYIINNTYY